MPARALAVTLLLAFADAPQDDRRPAGFSFRSDVRVVLVPATVTRDKTFVTGLTAGVFRVLEDGVEQEIVSFATHEAALEVVVAIDASSSMISGMPKARQAVKSFLSHLGPDDQVTLVAFSDETFTISGRDDGPAARLQALQDLEPFGQTSLYDAIARSLQTLEGRPGKRAVVVFTDGEDVTSQMSLEEIEGLVESGNSTLFMIGIEQAIEDDRLRGVLERLSERSGGRALLDEKLEDLEAAFGTVYREIRSQYLLGYSPANQDFDGRWRSIDLELTLDGHEVRGREGYRANK